MNRRVALVIVIALLLAGSLDAAAAPIEPPPAPAQARWSFRAQVQFPLLAANHAVGGLGLAAAAERGPFALSAETQIFPVVVCEDSCGNAYAVGLGFAFQPHLTQQLTAHLALVVQHYWQPNLSQSFTAFGPRVGLRWPDHGVAVSLDAGLAFASSSNFEGGGFAANKILSWAMPELMLGLWF